MARGNNSHFIHSAAAAQQDIVAILGAGCFHPFGLGGIIMLAGSRKGNRSPGKLLAAGSAVDHSIITAGSAAGSGDFLLPNSFAFGMSGSGDGLGVTVAASAGIGSLTGSFAGRLLGHLGGIFMGMGLGLVDQLQLYRACHRNHDATFR